MFGRRHSADSDAAAVARRRLAMLAAQFNPNTSATDVDGAPPITYAGAVEDAPPNDGVPVVGRHAASKAVEHHGSWSLTAHQVTVVALIVAAVVAVAAWWVLRSVPEAAPVQLTSERSLPATSALPPASASAPPVATPTGGAIDAPAAQANAGAPLVVDVAGKVRRPGIVELPPGARVVDAIRAAGGARPGVSTASLNLARPLADGEQIVVGLKVPSVDLVPPPPAAGTTTTAAIASVDLNVASQAELETLPGIGPVTAASILAWRTDNGPFSSVDELLEVSGIGDVTLANIEAYVHV